MEIWVSPNIRLLPVILFFANFGLKYGHCMLTIAKYSQLSLTINCHQFITPSIHLHLQQDVCGAVHRAGPSASADTCMKVFVSKEVAEGKTQHLQLSFSSMLPRDVTERV